ncbi:MAG: fibronectin type III domain-containing protein [Acidobacteriaceae bacterium]
MPRQTTDKVPLREAQLAHICWETAGAGEGRAAFNPGACASAGDGRFAPGKQADFTAAMPAELIGGTLPVVNYFVELENHAGKTAGPSNAALVATGSAPAVMAGLHLSAQPAGVVLHWVPATPQAGMVLRIRRTLSDPGRATGRGAGKASGNAAPQEQQTLEVDLGRTDPGEALDHDALLDHVWKYQAERVLRVEVDHHALEIAGEPSAAVTIDAKDVFPPAVPAGLVAVADGQAHAIDLSWVPDTDPGLAGYVVYRRDLATGSAPERISAAQPIVPPSFTDAHVVPGHRYAYSVRAVDQDGNHSLSSGEVEEELPQ